MHKRVCLVSQIHHCDDVQADVNDYGRWARLRAHFEGFRMHYRAQTRQRDSPNSEIEIARTDTRWGKPSIAKNSCFD